MRYLLILVLLFGGCSEAERQRMAESRQNQSLKYAKDNFPTDAEITPLGSDWFEVKFKTRRFLYKYWSNANGQFQVTLIPHEEKSSSQTQNAVVK